MTDGGARYLRVSADRLVAIRKAMEPALGVRAAECLVAGVRVGEAKHAAAPACDARTHVEAALAAATRHGWGEFALERRGASELVVTVCRSPFAETYGRAAAPVCHLTLGMLEALAAALFQRPARVRETACAAAGAGDCRFETLA
ncbi:MAG: V4R domain-containing protein [Candidatus Rokuibacteriota bacterium]